MDMEGLSKASNGYMDAIIVKYDKNLENILWKKSFGGSDDDEFNSIVKINDNELIVVGYSKSSDMDMLGLNNLDRYKKSIIVKYNINNGNLIEKKVFGGNNSDYFNKIIKTNNNKYLMAGGTYSNDDNVIKFNKGFGDAVVVKYDSNLKIEESLQESVVLIDKLKEIEPNYGTNISLKYNNIYTSNDPTKDLNNWCSFDNPSLEENNSNYYYGQCLKSFNNDDAKMLVEKEITNGLPIKQGEKEYVISQQASNTNNWLQIAMVCSGYTKNLEYSNLKLKFNDGYIGYIENAVNDGYLEPLVTITSWSRYNDSRYLFPNVMNIINGGSTGVAQQTSRLYINIKPKKSTLESIYLTSNKDTTGYDGLGIYELRNFDMSITPTN